MRNSSSIDGNDKEELTRHLLDIAQRIWFAYLRAWQLGGQYYGRQSTTWRLAWRDAFLSPAHQAALLKVLADKALRQKQQQQPKQEDEDSARPDESPSSSQVEQSKSSNTNISSRQSRTSATQHYQNRYYSLQAHFTQGQCKGSREAALTLRPSMTAVVALVYVAVQRAGVALRHLIDWMRNGDWPIASPTRAYRRLLTRWLQTKLTLVQGFFTLPALPRVEYVEYLARLWLVAGGVNSWESWRGLPTKKETADEENVDDENNNEPPNKKQKRELLAAPSILPVPSIPILLAQAVADWRLGQKVLNYSLALVGLTPVDESIDPWLRREIPVLIPAEDLRDATDVWAILLCAVLLVHVVTPAPAKTPRKLASTPPPERCDWKRTLHPNLVPWSSHEFANLTHGQACHYVQTFGRTSETNKSNNNNESLLPDFTKLLQKQEERIDQQMKFEKEIKNENDDDNDSNEENKDQKHVRACPIAIVGPLYSDSNEPLRRLIMTSWQMRKKRAPWRPLTWPSVLSVYEHVWIEFVASVTHVSCASLIQSLQRILLVPKPRRRRRRHQAAASASINVAMASTCQSEVACYQHHHKEPSHAPESQDDTQSEPSSASSSWSLSQLHHDDPEDGLVVPL